MTRLEEEFKNRFKDQHSSEGIDSEGLWNDIASSLNDVDGGGVPPKSNFRFIGLALFAILFSGTVTYFYNGDQEKAATKTSSNDSFEKNDAEITGDVVNSKTINERITIQDEKSAVNESISFLKAKNEASLSSNSQQELSNKEVTSMNDRYNSDPSKKVDLDRTLSANNPKISTGKEHDKNTSTVNVSVASIDKSVASPSTLKSNPETSREKQLSDKTVFRSDVAKEKDNVNQFADKEFQADETRSTNNKVDVSSMKNESSVKGSIDDKSGSEINTIFSPDVTDVELSDNTFIDQSQLNAGDHLDFMKTTLQSSIPSIKLYSLRTKARHDIDLDYYSDQKQIPLEIGVLMGVNTGFVRYVAGSSENSELQSELKKTHKNDLGFSGSLSLAYKLNRKWYLESGVDVLSVRSKFDYYQELDTNLSYGFQLIEYDVVSGDTINEIYQEQFVPAILKRTVLHHNNATAISIPISIGRTYALKNFNIGASAGVIFRWYKNQSGKLLNQESDIMAYNEMSNGNSLYEGLTIGYRLSPFIEKTVSDHIKIRLRSLIDFQPSKEMKLHGLKQADSSFSLQLGLIYKF